MGSFLHVNEEKQQSLSKRAVAFTNNTNDNCPATDHIERKNNALWFTRVKEDHRDQFQWVHLILMAGYSNMLFGK